MPDLRTYLELNRKCKSPLVGFPTLHFIPLLQVDSRQLNNFRWKLITVEHRIIEV